MKIRKKKLYEYDIKSGHYVRINEDDNVSTDATANATPDKSQKQEAKPVVNQTLVDAQKKANEVDSVEKQKAVQNFHDKVKNIDTQYDRDLTAQKELLAASDNAAMSTEDSVSKSRAQSDSILIKKKIADIEMKHSIDVAEATIAHAKELYQLECMKLDALQKGVNSIANENYKNLPEKYRGILNESNIHQAKIYMTNIVVNDDEHIIKDMRDFKRVFGESELIYGKDKKGFFVICIDLDDFNKLYATLQEVGYRRDDIFANVMPLVLDRSSMISIDTIK